jgi:CheY-like chemotaxis protein
MAYKILIVDDEPNIVMSLEFLMKKEGFEVAVANDGDEALAKVGELQPRSPAARRHDAEENQASKSARPCVPTLPGQH